LSRSNGTTCDLEQTKRDPINNQRVSAGQFKHIRPSLQQVFQKVSLYNLGLAFNENKKASVVFSVASSDRSPCAYDNNHMKHITTCPLSDSQQPTRNDEQRVACHMQNANRNMPKAHFVKLRFIFLSQR
jgi:hypothetical protein